MYLVKFILCRILNWNFTGTKYLVKLSPSPHYQRCCMNFFLYFLFLKGFVSRSVVSIQFNNFKSISLSVKNGNPWSTLSTTLIDWQRHPLKKINYQTGKVNIPNGLVLELLKYFDNKNIWQGYCLLKFHANLTDSSKY